MKGEVAVEVGVVVRQKMRVGDGKAIPMFDAPLREKGVERPLVVELAWHEQALELRRLHVLTCGVALAHHEREAITVDVFRDPARVLLVGPPIARDGTHVTPRLQDGLGAVGRDPRYHMKVNREERLSHRGRDPRDLVPRVEREYVLGDRERHARATHLGGVHISVDPSRRARTIELAADGQHPDLTPLRGAPQTLQPTAVGKSVGPRAQLSRERIVVEVVGAETAMERGEGRHRLGS